MTHLTSDLRSPTPGLQMLAAGAQCTVDELPRSDWDEVEEASRRRCRERSLADGRGDVALVGKAVAPRARDAGSLFKSYKKLAGTNVSVQSTYALL